MAEDIPKHSVHTLVFRSLKRTHDMFLSDYLNPVDLDDKALRIRKAIKTRDEYGSIMNLPKEVDNIKSSRRRDDDDEESETSTSLRDNDDSEREVNEYEYEHENDRRNEREEIEADFQAQSILPTYQSTNISQHHQQQSSSAVVLFNDQNKSLIAPKRGLLAMPKPQWHAPWKLCRVISGHLGWVRCIDVEPGNEWFATGSGDRLIKIWDLGTGTLKLSLTGHISAVRGVAISSRHPYLFSCGEDKQVKCWDLEQNKVVRHYHGHLSACYALALHPTLDILVSAGRDSVARLWDMRSKAQIHCLNGHTNTVSAVKCQETDPQIITCSHDTTIRCWDIIAGKTMITLTNHKKSVRALAMHPKWNSMASASPDNIKEWKLPKAEFVQNLSGHNSILNALAVNSDNVLVSGADNGSLYFWDWLTGYNFQRLQTMAQPGSIDSEMGIFAMTYDQSGTRLITCEADKTIKIYKEDDEATEESHPVNWKPDILKRKRF